MGASGRATEKIAEPKVRVNILKFEDEFFLTLLKLENRKWRLSGRKFSETPKTEQEVKDRKVSEI